MYRPIETMPRDGLVRSVRTRANNVRGCRFANDRYEYRSVHKEWHDTTWDPPLEWWDGEVPGAKSGAWRYVENK